MSPSPKKAPAAVVGLDIGSDSIKIAEAKLTKGGVTITGMSVARTPEGVVENEVITDPQTLGRAIKAMLAENGIKTKKCVSSVGGQSQVVVRVIEVPRMSKDELAETMKWEIERHVPFAANEIVKDFQPLDRPNADPNSPNMEVLLAVAQQDLISSHVETLTAAGLKPMAIDVESLASSRSLIDLSPNGAADETIAIVNIGSTRTDVGIYENGVLTFPSPPLGIAGMSFTREIAEALGQTLEQAEITKKEYAAVDLNGFAQPPADDQHTTDTGVQASEQTEFNTVFTAPSSSIGGFSLGTDLTAPAEPLADSPAEDLSQPGASEAPIFVPPVDVDPSAPAFDTPTPGETGGPSFDLGEPEQPLAAASPADLGGPEQPLAAASPADLGEPEQPLLAASPADLGLGAGTADSAAASDLGGATAAGPDFDLQDVEPAADHTSAKLGFDLGDVGAHGAVDEAAAQPLSIAPTSATPMEKAVFQAISGVLVDLATELRTSIEYYSGRYGKLPQRVFLCGGTAKMPRLAEFLSNELGVPVEVADPVKNLTVNIPGASGQYLKEISPLFSVSIGLAIRDMIG